ncbi:MAG: TAXI family TRAP transporter solute-binding subunit [Geminicoccaceae bacterium]
MAAAVSTSVRADNLALEPKSDSEWKQAVNGGTVQILTKGLGCTCTVIASDMAAVLNETGSLRILPVIGHGSLQGIADIMYLRGIDLSILQADVLSYVRRRGIHEYIDQRVRYVTKLYNSELHLIAGPGIETIQDLDGKVVSYDVKGRGSFITAENVFESLGIDVDPVHHERDVSIEKIRQGEIAAAFVVTGKPADSMRSVKPGDGLHFLSVPMTSNLSETYLPSSLTHDDYPELIEPGEDIKTISVPEVLAVYNWPEDHERYAKVRSVVDAFFDNFDKFKDEVRHPKWQDVDLMADLPGWERFQPAKDWLDRNARLASEDNFELKVGDQVIRVRGDRVEAIDDIESGETNRRAESNITANPTTGGSGLQEIASTPTYIDVAPASSSEGEGRMAFNFELSQPADADVPIIFKTIQGTAEVDADFKEQNGIMIIEPGVTKAALEIDVVDDRVAEDEEFFLLVLSVDPTVAVLEEELHTATIKDDD